MIVRADTAVSFLIEFASGAPDRNIAWKLYGPDRLVAMTGTVVVPVGAVSVNLEVPGVENALTVGTLNSYRDVEWAYTTDGAVVNGEARYLIEGRIPFGAAASGVRNKLGIDDDLDLPDNEISLVSAYKTFVAAVDPIALAAADPADIGIRNAIEALAALTVLPTLSVRLPLKENSGTSSFQRLAVDWAALTASLNLTVTAGYTTLNPDYDPTASFTSIFILATPVTDAFTGDAAI